MIAGTEEKEYQNESSKGEMNEDAWNPNVQTK